MTAKAPPAAGAWLSNQRLFRLHGWLGINLGLLLFIVCFSGAIATVSHEIEWLLNPAVRAAPPAAGAPFASWTAWYRAVREAHPEGDILSIDAPEGPRWAARATIEYADGDWRYVFVDPYAARVNGSFSEFGVVRFFRSFHKQFYIYPGSLPHGVYAVGPLGLVLLLSLVTGLSFYRFRTRDLLLRGPWKTRRAFWSSLHRATGMWIMPMAVLITATGVWYFVERTLQDADVDVPTSAARRPAAEPGAPTLWPMPIEAAVALAEQTAPRFRATAVSFSIARPGTLTIRGQADAWVVRDAANVVRVNAHSGRVEEMSLASELGVLARWTHTADPLHFGTFGGVPTRIIWFIAGLIMSAAILLGVRVWYLRSQPAADRAASLAHRLAGVSITLVVLGVSIYGCLANIGDALAHGAVGRVARLGVLPLAGLPVRVTATANGDQTRVSALVAADAARDDLRRGWAWVGGAAAPAGVARDAVSLTGRWEGLTASLATPAGVADDSRLWLAVEDAAGRTSMASVPLGAATRAAGSFTPAEHIPLSVWVVIALFTIACAIVCVGWFSWIQRSVARASTEPVARPRPLVSIVQR